MAGLVPAIYVFSHGCPYDVDARDKPGHDEKISHYVKAKPNVRSYR